MQNIIFDWSGTLVDDLPPVFKAMNRIFLEHGKPAFELIDFRKHFRLPFAGFYEEFLPDITMEEVERLYHEYFEPVQDEVQLLPHALDFLEFCKQSGRRLFILSTVKKDHFLRQAERLGVADYFEHAYAGIMDKRHKIHGLLQEHHLAREDTMFIGDMTHDVDTANHGGVTSVATLTGYDPVEKLIGSDPAIIVRNLGELQRLLQSRPIFHMPVSTVGAAIFHRDGDILLLKTRKWSNKWGIPGGKIQRGESAVEALRREIQEETALPLDKIDFVMVQDCIDSPEFLHRAHFLLLNYKAVTSKREVVLNNEAEEYCWISLEKALRMDLNNPTRVLLEEIGRTY